MTDNNPNTSTPADTSPGSTLGNAMQGAVSSTIASNPFLGTAIAGAQAGASMGQTAADFITGKKGWTDILFGDFTIARVIFVILGLMLIAAGIFSFRAPREMIIQTAGKAVKAAVV